MVPLKFLVGNETTTIVDGVRYFNARLRDDREYAIVIRIDTVSDNEQVTDRIVWLLLAYGYVVEINYGFCPPGHGLTPTVLHIYSRLWSTLNTQLQKQVYSNDSFILDICV